MDKITVFVALTGIAILLQAGILLAMYLAMRESGARIEAIATELKTKLVPTIEQAGAMLSEFRPKLEIIADMVHNTVISPVRQLSGLMQGLTVGLEFLFGGRARKNGNRREERRPVPQDEMFI